MSPIFSNAPPYTIPDDTDPVEIIRSITRQQHDKYRALLRQYAESGQDIYFVVTGDWHAPDEDPVAQELMMEIAGMWVAGQQHTLHIRNGDHACFPTLYGKNSTPFWLMYPHTQTLGNYLWATFKHVESLDKDWHEIIADNVWVTGNHDDVRLFRALWNPDRAQPEVSEVLALTWVNLLIKHGTIWLGTNVHQLLLRPDFKILHGQYARKNAGQSVAAQMEADGYAYDLTIQGHAHRSGTYRKKRADGSVAVGHEIGHSQADPPLYNSGRTENWMNGMGVGRMRLGSREPIEFHNIAFTPEVRKDGRYLIAHFEGMEFRKKYPATVVDRWQERLGLFAVNFASGD